MKAIVEYAPARGSFKVKGDYLDEALADATTHHPNGYAAWTEIEGPTWTVFPKTGEAERVVFRVSYRVVRPVWPARESAPKACQAEWDNIVKRLAAHEDEHVRLLRADMNGLISLCEKRMGGMTATEVDRKLSIVAKRIQERQDDLDARTEHGTSGTLRQPIPGACRRPASE